MKFEQSNQQNIETKAKKKKTKIYRVYFWSDKQADIIQMRGGVR